MERRTALDFTGKSPVNRRFAIGAAVAATAGLTIPQVQPRGRVVTQRGMVGGGLAQFELSEAQFSAFAARLIFDDGQEVILGSFIWVDPPSGFTFVGNGITSYEVIDIPPDQGQARRTRGTVSVNGEGEYPFVFEAYDVGPPGAGQDSVVLTVGDGAVTAEGATPVAGTGFSYAAAGPIVVGDMHDVDIEVDLETGAIVAATPPA
jgi:hypothetical protein